ncbi:MAG: cation diffusion facilitator family transporter [Spirochaetia bacterium]
MKQGAPGRRERLAIWMGIIGNALLFCAKVFVGVTFNSIALISDSVNSLTDLVASTIVFISIRSSYRAPDAGHPFGHKRAQPIAGLVVAILTGIVGFEIIAQSTGRLFDGTEIQKGVLPIILLAVVLVVKLGMYLFARFTARQTGSTALMASAMDHRNDVLISAAVLLGVGASNLGMPVFDPLAAIAVGVWIIWAGFRIGRDNIKYLMGEAPAPEMVARVLAKAREVPGLLGVNEVSAHYVGTTVEIELHIDVDSRLNVAEAHEIATRVQRAVESMEEVSRAFIHVEPLEAT